MEIVNIEARTFEEMMERFESFVQKVEKLCSENNSNRMSKWLDSQDVCQIMDISKRNLQTLRDSGRLAYTQVERKFYYKPDDVEALIQNIKTKGGGE